MYTVYNTFIKKGEEKTMLQNGKIYLGLSDLDGTRVEMPLSICNRHGLIAGASGTGKTITMKVMAIIKATIKIPYKTSAVIISPQK